MIGKIISKSAQSEEAAVLKKDAGNGNEKKGAIPVFKSLMDALRGDNISAGNEKSMAEGMLSDEEIESLTNEVNHSEAVHAKAGNIFSLLSEGDPKSEGVMIQAAAKPAATAKPGDAGAVPTSRRSWGAGCSIV